MLAALCDDALRAPTAGHARGVEAVVLAGATACARYLRRRDRRGVARDVGASAAGCARAGGVVVVLCDPAAYAARYAESDKSSSGLGDVAALARALLVRRRGVPSRWRCCCSPRTTALGACFLGAFRNDARRARRGAGARRARRAVRRGARSADAADDAARARRSTRRPGPSRADARACAGGSLAAEQVRRRACAARTRWRPSTR